MSCSSACSCSWQQASWWSHCSTPSSSGSRNGDRRCVRRNHAGRARKHGDRNVSLADPMPATNREMLAPLRFYLAHERAILGALMVVLFLFAWEGLERGWWAQLLRPFLGVSAERWQLKP